MLKTGKLATTSCPEPPIIDLGIPRTREYLTTVMKCLDKSWSAHFARAGLRFRKPTVRFYEEPAQKVCGTVPWPVNVGALYCTERATLVFPLTGDWIENRTDLYPFKIAAHEYGHHLQSLTGVRRDYEARVRSDPAHQNELNRRYELQADCLSGVFLGSVRRSLPRTAQDWESLSDELRASGDDPGHRTHGAAPTGSAGSIAATARSPPPPATPGPPSRPTCPDPQDTIGGTEPGSAVAGATADGRSRGRVWSQGRP
ncbi:neutral zinc metallopeptidase [Streptosporangium lutulentum]